MQKLNLDELPAFPDNVADCHAEFRRLYTLMYNERLRTWKQIEKWMLAHKSAQGEVKSYKKQYLEAKKRVGFPQDETFVSALQSRRPLSFSMYAVWRIRRDRV